MQAKGLLSGGPVRLGIVKTNKAGYVQSVEGSAKSDCGKPTHTPRNEQENYEAVEQLLGMLFRQSEDTSTRRSSVPNASSGSGELIGNTSWTKVQ